MKTKGSITFQNISFKLVLWFYQFWYHINTFGTINSPVKYHTTQKLPNYHAIISISIITPIIFLSSIQGYLTYRSWNLLFLHCCCCFSLWMA